MQVEYIDGTLCMFVSAILTFTDEQLSSNGNILFLFKW